MIGEAKPVREREREREREIERERDGVTERESSVTLAHVVTASPLT